jgi:NADPH-dependent 2,4-dienoyl-CoA reductase/sulfur reductase-like enzyme
MMQIVIVGAGPAGIAAATALVPSSAAITVVDEAPQPGGQIHRMPVTRLALDMRRLLAEGHTAYQEFHTEVAALRDRVRFLPETLAWNVYGGEVHLAGPHRLEAIRYDALILATGATDRVMPVSGWTLPGVFTLGAAQVLLKSQGCLLGDRVVFCGSSPLLYLAAVQYVRMGGQVAAILDTTDFAQKLRALPGMFSAPGLLAKGLGYMANLRRHGVPTQHGIRLHAFEGREKIEAIVYETADNIRCRIECDAVAYGYGLHAETQLAELASCDLQYDATYRQHLPVIDADGRAGRAIYLAGDGCRIGGAEAASLAGTIAGNAAAVDLGLRLLAGDLPTKRRRLNRLYRAQQAMAGAFAWPVNVITTMADNVLVCRCENVTAGEIRQSLGLPIGVAELNRVKAATRCGMGRCQGRVCGPSATELTAAVLGRTHAPLDRFRAQPPVKPLPINLVESGI